MKKILSLAIVLILGVPFTLKAQFDDLEAQLLSEMDEITDYTVGTFLSENVVVGKSTMLQEKNNIAVRFRHHFNPLKSGAKDAFGFNKAYIYAEVGYAPADWVNLGLAYGNNFNSINGSAKFRVLRQSTGKVFMPVNLSVYGAVNYRTNSPMAREFSDQLDYTAQVLISRRFHDYFSLQLAPTYLHRNLVPTPQDQNDLFALGTGASIKLLKNLRLNLEYYWVSNNNETAVKYYDPFSAGVSYQTSRHTFELFVTNSAFMEENYMLGSNTGNFWKGDVRLGFNVAINFTVGKKHKVE